ncbi:MAG TPA: transketolase [Thermoplasmata archaeon]|nr:transketolase [Thermoplasmata archaeon]
MKIKELESIALQIRKDIVKMIYLAGSGHPGGSLSAVEIYVALYFKIMRHDPENPKWVDRDRFVASKGHSAPALYSVLARSGYFSLDELWKLRKTGEMLQGHPCMKKVPGVDMSTGSLGQGLSAACGIAMGLKLDRKSSYVYALLGDGEMQSGNIWEAAAAASHYKLDNLIAILDRNHLQIDGSTERVMSIEPIAFRWKSFGWHTLEIDGHNFQEILDAVEKAKSIKGKPTVIIAHTVKGKGVSFMEGSLSFHGKAPTKEQYEQAIYELEHRRIGGRGDEY